jgi:hypothetical protein
MGNSSHPVVTLSWSRLKPASSNNSSRCVNTAPSKPAAYDISHGDFLRAAPAAAAACTYSSSNFYTAPSKPDINHWKSLQSGPTAAVHATQHQPRQLRLISVSGENMAGSTYSSSFFNTARFEPAASDISLEGDL